MLDIESHGFRDSRSDRILNLLGPNRSKSLPDLQKPQSNQSTPRYPRQVFTSTLHLPGPHAFFLTPIGPQSNRSGPGIFGGLVYAPLTNQEKYLTAHVSISTHFSRPHEFEDLQNSKLRQLSDFFFFPQVENKKPTRILPSSSPLPLPIEREVSSTLSNILSAQPQDCSLTLQSVDDITLTRDPVDCSSASMAVPTQYDVEHQLNGVDDNAAVITHRTASFHDLRRKFEEARTMYLPRDPTLLKDPPKIVTRRSQSVGPLKSRPRSAIYKKPDPQPHPIARPTSLSVCEQKSTPRSYRRVPSRSYEADVKRLTRNYESGMNARRENGYSPTKRRLPGLVNRNPSPRSMNRAAGSNDWPDGIFAKTGDVYKRLNSNEIAYNIPTPEEVDPQSRNIDYRREQLSVDCGLRSPSPRMRDRPSPCLNYSYLEHTDASGLKPYRSVNLSDWKGIPSRRKASSCMNLYQPELVGSKRYSVPRQMDRKLDDESWKIRAQEIGGGRRRIHAVRGSWSPTPSYSPPRSIPGDLEEPTEREVMERTANRSTRWSPPRIEPPLPSPPPLSLPPPRYSISEGVDESSIAREFDSTIARFEKLAIESRNEALCTKCSDCCLHSPAARQPYPSRRLFSTRRARSERTQMVDGEPARSPHHHHPHHYRVERGGFDRYYGNGTVEVIDSPGGKMYSRGFEPYPLP